MGLAEREIALQWFIEEQVEEERTMRELLDLLDSGINLFAARVTG